MGNAYEFKAVSLSSASCIALECILHCLKVHIAYLVERCLVIRCNIWHVSPVRIPKQPFEKKAFLLALVLLCGN